MIKKLSPCASSRKGPSKAIPVIDLAPMSMAMSGKTGKGGEPQPSPYGAPQAFF